MAGTQPVKLQQLPVYSELQDLAKTLRSHGVRLEQLLKDEARCDALIKKGEGIILDISRQKLNQEVLSALLRAAEAMQVPQKIQSLFNGDILNKTEERAVLHTLLRFPSFEDETLQEVSSLFKEISAVREKVYAFAEDVRKGVLKGYTGKALQDVICIGIGGSYLGAEFIFEALKFHSEASNASSNRRLRFLANVDPVDIKQAVHGLNPESTLVIIISKTFTTLETMLNAQSMKEWLLDGLRCHEEDLGNHLVAVSSNLPLAVKFGVKAEKVFTFWDSIGGRFSVTSAVGLLPLALQYGREVVEQFLSGCHAMDLHFKNTKLADNLPVLMALSSCWNSTFLNIESVAVLPYAQALHRFAAHVQQLLMESNGKGVAEDGTPLAFHAGEIYFGEPGTNSQHSFFQLLHQGRTVGAEFIGFCDSQTPVKNHNAKLENHDELMANFFSQPDALAIGMSADELRNAGVSKELIPHRIFSGDRPSTVLLLPEVSPYYVGVLLSLYENRAAVQGFLWGINSFDQWGVELGKLLAKNVRVLLEKSRDNDSFPERLEVIKNECPKASYSTKKLLARYLQC